MSMTRRPTTPRNSRTRTRVQANAKQSPPPPEPGLDLEIMTITPELAQEWLDRGGTTRKTIRRRIEAMTAAIQRGEWQLTGEAIKLDQEGRVRDGQNRLHAIVEAGIPVRSVVARGVSEDAFDVMDTGRSRNAADVLHPRLSIPECHGRRRARIDVHRTLRTGVPQPAGFAPVRHTRHYAPVRPGAPRDHRRRAPGRPHLPVKRVTTTTRNAALRAWER